MKMKPKISYIVFLLKYIHIITSMEMVSQIPFNSSTEMNCSPCSCHWSPHCLVVDCFNLSLDKVPDFLPTATCQLNLTENNISTITSRQFQRFPLLTTLDLSNNSIAELRGAPFSSLQMLLSLNVSANNISYLHEGAFANLSNLMELNLSNCYLNSIESEALSPLQNIRTLDLSQNQNLGFNGLQNATAGLQSSKVKTLIINRIVRVHELCVTISEQHLENLQNTSLETIYASDNEIMSFETDALYMMPKTLKYVSVRNNRFSYARYVMQIPQLTGLKDLDLGGHRTTLHDLIPFIPIGNLEKEKEYPVCALKRKSMIQLTHEHLDDQAFSFFTYIKTDNLSRLPIPPNLERVRYKFAEYSFVIPEIHFGENKLHYIDMSYNIIARWEGPILGLNHLQHLDMSQNVASYVSDDFFMNLSTVTFLNISGNSLERSISKDIKGTIFRNLHYLENLDLSKHFIPHLPRNVFQGLKSLIYLNISYNNIFNLTLNLTNSKNLTFLNCSYNQMIGINSYQQHQFELLAKSHKFSIDLTGNPLHCHCIYLEYWEWFLNSRTEIFNVNNYICKFKNRTTTKINNLREFVERLKVSCVKYDKFALLLGIISLSSVTALVILVSLLYRYRWKLRYLYYAAKIRMRKSVEPVQSFDFDAFVSYADEDRDFIINCLMPNLENQGLRLNIHHRDFVPGNAIAENIVDAIQRSSKTILVLTSNFLKSEWCRYEVSMANMECITTGRDVMLILMMEDIRSRDIPPEILYQIQTNTYIEYPKSDTDDSDFWNHLCQTLGQ